MHSQGSQGCQKIRIFFLQIKVLSSWHFGSQNIKNRVFRFELFSVHLPLWLACPIRLNSWQLIQNLASSSILRQCDIPMVKCSFSKCTSQVQSQAPLISTLYNVILRIARNLLETRENIKISTNPFHHINLDRF